MLYWYKKNYKDLTLQQLIAKENTSLKIIQQYSHLKTVWFSYAKRHMIRVCEIREEYKNRFGDDDLWERTPRKV